MYNSDTELLFPLRVIPNLVSMRGEEWRALLDRVTAQDASLADQRVKEIIYLEDKGEAARVVGVTNDLNSYLSRITELSGGIARVSSAAAPQYGAAGSGAGVRKGSR